MRIGISALICCFVIFFLDAASGGPRYASMYGSLTIISSPGKPNLPLVRFDHWLHRSQYTCRLCHVDLGFTMQHNASGISADMIQKGYFCGACHNGKTTYHGNPIFGSCSKESTAGEKSSCDRCHTDGKPGSRKHNYETFAEQLPKDIFSGLINWEEAEARGLIRPIDFLEGVSIPRKPLSAQEDFSIKSKSAWMPDTIFSHKKHALWNGCEVCHPDIFPSTKRGKIKYSMLEISGGQYCGLCHNRVAFPLNQCQKCHVNRTGR